MKKLLIGILLCFMFVPAVQAETFTEANLAGDVAGVPGVIVVELRKERAQDDTVTTSVVVRYRTVDGSGNGVRSMSVDITSGLNASQLTYVNNIITKALNEAKTSANIP